MGQYSVVKYYHEGTTEPNFEPSDAENKGKDELNGWKVYEGAVPSPKTATNTIYTRTVSMPAEGASGYAGLAYDLIITSETCQATAAAVADTFKTAPATVLTGWNLK